MKGHHTQEVAESSKVTCNKAGSTYPFELGVSKIKGAGVGLFARRAFKRGEVLRDYVGEDCVLVKDHPDRDMTHKFGHRTAEGWYLPPDFGRMSLWWYANHSSAPNVDCENERYVALQDIEAGDEITTDYQKLEPGVDNLGFRPMPAGALQDDDSAPAPRS
jgi:hypothetical protein